MVQDLEDLKKKISEIVGNLNATHEVDRSYFGGGYRESSGGGHAVDDDYHEWISIEPDNVRSSKGSQDLEALVKNTDLALLIQVPEFVVLNEVGRVYRSDVMPFFVEVIRSDRWPDKLKIAAAEKIRYAGIDAKVDKILVEMMNTPNCRYAAKALTRSACHEESKEIVESFFSHWRDIDASDWKLALTLSCNRDILQKEIAPRLLGILTDENQEAELKRRSLDALISLDLLTTPISRKYKIEEQQRKNILRYALERWDEEGGGSFVQLFYGSTMAYKNIEDICEIALNTSQDRRLRIKIINIFGKFEKPLKYLTGIRSISYPSNKMVKYLKRAGSRLFGRFFEPDEDLRLAAREAYAKIK